MPAGGGGGGGPVGRLASNPEMLIATTDWTFYSQPAPRYGVEIGKLPVGSSWDVTGRWRPQPDPAGHQWWIIAPYNTWYRLRVDVSPVGLVSAWALLPDRWLQGNHADVPWIDAPWGIPWDTVPYSRGLVAIPRYDDLPLFLCPQADCPVLERASGRTPVPVTGRRVLANADWYRVEYDQSVLWTPSDQTRLRRPAADWLFPHVAGWRTCKAISLFPPPRSILCRTDRNGRLLDAFEQKYDQLDPYWGREPYLHEEG